MPSLAVGRRVVEQALQTGQLRLDRRGHGLGHIFGRGAGEHRLNLDCGRRDLGVARDRQQPDGEHAQEGDDQADDDGENRPPDEEVVDLVVGPAGGHCSGVRHFVVPGVGFTLLPADPPTAAVSSGPARRCRPVPRP